MDRVQQLQFPLEGRNCTTSGGKPVYKLLDIKRCDDVDHDGHVGDKKAAPLRCH